MAVALEAVSAEAHGRRACVKRGDLGCGWEKKRYKKVKSEV
jgi:hypothetical protein